MEVRLVLSMKGTPRRAVRLRQVENLVGRNKGCEVRIPHAEVSRRHCLLRVEDGYLTVEDLDSSNGTYLNGERVRRDPEVVRPGDQLKIGPVRFIAEYQLSREAIDRLLAQGMVDVLEEEPAEQASDVIPVEEGEGLSAVLNALGEVERDSTRTLAPPEERELEEGDEDGEVDEEVEVAEVDEEWHMPEGGDLRDILSAMDDQRPPKKRRH